MRNKIIFTPIIMAVFVVMSGFTSPGVDQSESILNASKKKLESLDDFSASFTYTIQNPNLKPVTQSGSLKYQKGNYAITLEDQEIYCNGVKIWIHLPEDEEVQVMDYNEEEGMNVESIFKIYESSTESKFITNEMVHGVNTAKIYLKIQDPDLDYNQAYVWVNTRTNILEKVLLIDRRQTQAIYEFINIKINTGFDRSEFEFDTDSFEGDVYDDSSE